MTDAWEDRKRTKEEEFFQRQEREKLCRLRQEVEQKDLAVGKASAPPGDESSQKDAANQGWFSKLIQGIFGKPTAR